MADLWELRIRSFVGISFGASHYYATLNAKIERDLKVQVTRQMTASEAADMCIEDEWDGWDENDATPRFDSENDAVTAGIAVWEEISQPGDGLIKDACGAPSRAYAGPPGFVAEANRIYELAERHYEEELQIPMEDYRAWDALFSTWGLKERYFMGVRNNETYYRPARIAVVRRGDPWEFVSINGE